MAVVLLLRVAVLLLIALGPAGSLQPSPSAAPVETAPVYGTAILEGLGGEGWARDINANGDIVGYVTEPDSEVKLPALWREGVLELLATPDDPGGVATAINDEGAVVGYLQMPDGDPRPVQWRDGVPIVLDSPTGIGYVYDINNAGTLVGEVKDAAGGWQPALWDGDQITLLDTGEAGRGQARAINDRGQIAGAVSDSSPGDTWNPDDPVHAVMWEQGAMRVIGPLGSYAWDISASGVVVGTVPDPTGITGADGEIAARAVTWTDGEVAWIDAGEDVTETLGMAIDDRAGVAVSARDGEGPPRAVAVTAAGPVTLEGISDLSKPEAINGDGVVVGSVLYSGAGTQAVRWMPVDRLAESPAADGIDGPWVMQVLPALGGDASANDINAGGTVVGSVEHANSGIGRPAMWRDTTLTVLDTLGGREGEVHAINDTGTMAGSAENGTGQMRPVRWDSNGVKDLGTLGGPEGVAIAINASGQIVGWSETATGERHATLWDGDEITDLGTMGDDVSSALDINDAGQVVVVSTDEGLGGMQSWLWEDGASRSLSPEDVDVALAAAINGQGDIAGVFVASEGEGQGFLLEGDEPREIVAPAGSYWIPVGLNDDGTVVGAVILAEDSDRSTAAVWRDDVDVRLMLEADGLSSSAMAVNSKGFIAGWIREGGTEHAVVWLPVTALLADST